MRNISINDVELTVDENNFVHRITADGKDISIPEDSPVRIKYATTQLNITHTYNDRQVLSFVPNSTNVDALGVYLGDPVTAYRTIVQSNTDILQRMRNHLTSFVMYGSQGLSKEHTDMFGKTYRVIASLFDAKLAKEVEDNEHQVIPRLSVPNQLGPLIGRLLELHYGYITAATKDAECLSRAPIDSIISGRAPDNLTDWALEQGYICEEQAIRAKTF